MAQSTSLQMGARAQGMGYAASCLSDVWSLTNNIAGIAKTKSPVGAIAYNAIPSFAFFNRMAAAIALPVRPGVAGVSVFRFGDDLYNEQVLSLGFANTYGLAALGAKANYIQYHAEGVGTYTAFSVSFGGLANLTPHLSFGAHIVNINQPVINESTGDRIPTLLLAGMAFKFSENLLVAAEVEKDMQQPPLFKGGFEYRALKKFTFRSGFNLHPEAGFFGLGFKVKKFDLDYSLQFNPAFGLSHQATVTLPFTKT